MSTASKTCTHEPYLKGGTLGIKGGIYQLKWLMLFLYRGLQKSCNFRLATEMESAEKFDDIFFEYTENGHKVYRFLQVKHKEDEQKVITFDDLLNEGDGDFALLKYFISYRRIKSKEEFKEGILRDIIICTNLEFNFCEETSNDFFSEITCDDDILDISKNVAMIEKSKRYKFKDEFPRKNQVYYLLRNASTLHRVAKRLAHCFLYSKIIEDHQKNSVFKGLSGVLAKHVLDIKNNHFRTNFLISISELPQDIAAFQIVFRRKVEEEISRFRRLTASERKEKNVQIIELLNQTDILQQIHSLQQERNSVVKLNISKNFGEQFKNNVIPNDLVSDDEIKDFLNVLVLAVNQPNEEKLGLIIQKEIGKEFSVLRSEDVYNSLFIKMLNWMKKKDGVFLSHEDGKKIFENARRGFSVWFDVKEPVEFFTGRTKELKDLHALLQSRSELTMVVSCVIGLGGIGKSELARKYVQEYSEFYQHNIIWINSECHQTMVNSFVRLAKDKLRIGTEDSDGKRKHVKSIVEDVYRCFAQSKCLFIFDNAAAFTSTADDEGINEFLPNVPSDAYKPYIIITSRNQNWKSNIFRKLILNVFAAEEAFEFVKTALNLSESRSDEILRLIEMLQYLPLALQQAVAYIKQCDEELKCVSPLGEFSIDKYLESLHKSSKNVLNFSFSDFNIKTTYMIWNTTVEKIKQSQYGEEAIDILSMIAYLMSENISPDWFLSCVANDEMKLGKILLLLKNYSLIAINDGLISIHRLVQRVHKINLEESAEHKVIIKKCVQVLTEIYALGSTLLDDCSKKRKIIPHLENILSISDEFSNKGDNLLDANLQKILLTCLGDGYGDLGSPCKERRIYERLLNCMESDTTVAADFKRTGILINLGAACGDLGDFEKQKELCEKALFNLEALKLDNRNEKVSAYVLNYRALVKLSTAYSNLGHPSVAIEYLRKSLKMAEKVRGREHYECAYILKHLAMAYGRLGEYQKERDLLEEAFPILTKHYGSDHYYIGAIWGMLGAAYSDLNDDHRAMEYLQKSLEILENYYGPDHFQVADTLRDLGISLWKLGRNNEAKEVFERNICILEKHYGKESIHLIPSLKSFSVVCGCLEDQNKEISLLNRVLYLQENNNIDTSTTLVELMYRRMGLKYECGVKNFSAA